MLILASHHVDYFSSQLVAKLKRTNCHSEHSHMYIKDHLLHWQKKKAMLQLEKGSNICMCVLKCQLCCYYHPPTIRCSRIQPREMVRSASLLCRSAFALASPIHRHLVAPALGAAKSVLASACSHFRNSSYMISIQNKRKNSIEFPLVKTESFGLTCTWTHRFVGSTPCDRENKPLGSPVVGNFCVLVEHSHSTPEAPVVSPRTS